MPNFNDNLQPLPNDSWFEQQKRKQWIPGDTEQLINERDPYGIYSRIDANLGADAPAELRSDLAGMRATGEAADAKRAPLQAIYEGKAYSMPSKRSTVQQPEAVAALDLVMKNRAIAEQKAKDDALMREAQAERAAKRNREAADWSDKRELIRMEIEQKKRANAGLASAQQKPGFVRNLTNMVGLTEAEDGRIMAANTPEELAQARREIAAEKKAQKEQGVKVRMDIANDPNLTPEAKATLYGEAAKEAGVNLSPTVTGAIKQSGEKQLALASRNAAYAAVESIAGSYEQRLKSAIESGNLENVQNDMYQQVSDAVRRTGVEPDPAMVKEIVDRRVRAMIPQKVNEPSMLPGFMDLLNPAGYAYRLGTQLGERNRRSDMRAEAANKLLGY